MAKLVNKLQSIRVGVKHPNPGYSRWVAIGFSVPAGIGNENWDVTKYLGERLWLLKAVLIITTEGGVGKISCSWRIVSCTQRPFDGGQIATMLDPVVDSEWVGKPYAFYIGGDREFSFEMKRLYEGAPHRFAVWIQNGSAVDALHATCAFLISEG